MKRSIMAIAGSVLLVVACTDDPLTVDPVEADRVAIEEGLVRVVMPTFAAMTDAGPDKRPRYPSDDKLPVVARWQLPAMDPGDEWKRSVEVGSVEKGYYHVVVEVDARGPESSLGPYLIDDIHRETWMFVSEGGGFLTPDFEEDIFPAHLAPVPGPLRTRRPPASQSAFAAASVSHDGGSTVYVEVGHMNDGQMEHGVGAKIWANTINATDLDDDVPARRETRIVPSSGIVEFTCPSSPHLMLEGGADVPATSLVNGAGYVGYWDAYHSDCGDTIQVAWGTRNTHVPWTNLKAVIPRINEHFSRSRARVKWTPDKDHNGNTGSRYDPDRDEIIFAHDTYDDEWVASHEYGHALHHKALGGAWPADCGQNRRIDGPSSYECAFQEGFANYAASIGTPDNLWIPNMEGFHISNRAAEVEGNVAALFHDLIDSGTEEEGDKTSYSAPYIGRVFETCRVRRSGVRGSILRDDVSDFVWCLENRVDGQVHGNNFPRIDTPAAATELATEPSDWSASDIRSTWLKNVGR